MRERPFPSQRPRFARGTAAITAALLLFLGPAACSVIAGLDKLQFDHDAEDRLCATAKDCDDQNPCTVDTCAAEVCAATPTADGPSATQRPGDCLTITCAAGQPVEQPNDTDIGDDHEDCTLDGCNEGQPFHTAKPEHTACTKGGVAGSCSFGKCMSACDGALVCDDKNPCTVDACDNVTGLCVFNPLGEGIPTPGVTDVPGDCHRHLCVGGLDTSTADDKDLPLTVTDCDEEICTNGVPSNPPLSSGTPCGNGQVCSAFGQCGCSDNTQCKAPETCGGGSPGVPGVCGCATTTCGAQNKTCGIISDGCGGALSCDDGMKDGTETDVDCGGGGSCATKCAQGKTCAGATDCASGFCVDGVCCDSACAGACHACSASKKLSGVNGVCGNIAVGADPDSECALQPPTTCGTTGVCDGSGACQKYPSGTACSAPLCMGSTLLQADLCDAAGVCVDSGAQPCAPYNCSGGACLSTCSTDGDCDAAFSCTNSVCM